MFEIQFQDDSLVRSKTVIITTPFSVLRSSGSTSSSILEDTSLGLTPEMRTYIDTLSYGTNSKIIVPSGNLRLTYGVDLQGATAWSSVNQDLHILLGGKAGKKVSNTTASVYVDPFLKAANMTEADTSNITVVNWSKDPFAQGSYSVRKAGDVYGVYDEMNDMDDRLTRIATALYDKGVFFIGEHVSFKHKGFMEGAVQSGKAIAKIVAQRLQQ